MKNMFNRIKSFSSYSLFNKFMLFTVLIIFISLTFTSIYFYSSISSILINNSMNELMQNIKDINRSIDSQFNLADNTSMQILSNKIIQDNLEINFQSDDIYTKAKVKSNIEEELRSELRFNYAWDTKLLNALSIVKDDNMSSYYFVSRYFKNTELDEKYKNILSDENYLKVNKKIIPPTYKDNTIYFIRNVESIDVTNLKYKLILEINENIISSCFNGLLKYNKAVGFIIDNTGTVISHTDKRMLGTKMNDTFLSLNETTQTNELKINNITYIASSQKLNNYNLTSIIVIPKNLVLSDLKKSMTNYLIITVLFIMTTLFIGISLTRSITKPIKDLLHNISQFSKGNFNAKMPLYKEIELNEISNIFNNMTDKIDELFNDIYKKQLLLKDAELKSLQSQINPHFMFNTLLSIAWEAKASGNELTYKMVTSLSNLMRSNIYLSGREKITIKQEFEYINCYLFLQKTRFQDRFNFIISDVDDEVMHYYLPKLIIQSVVENAVIHGLENKIENGVLRISLVKDCTSLYFMIEDDGVGFDINTINLSMDAQSTHIGLYNVNKRIKLLYGDEYGLTLESEITKGSKITIHIPIDEEG